MCLKYTVRWAAFDITQLHRDIKRSIESIQSLRLLLHEAWVASETGWVLLVHALNIEETQLINFTTVIYEFVGFLLSMKQPDIDMSSPAWIKLLPGLLNFGQMITRRITHLRMPIDRVGVFIVKSEFWSGDNRQTGGKRCIRAHFVGCTGGLNKWQQSNAFGDSY